MARKVARIGCVPIISRAVFSMAPSRVGEGKALGLRSDHRALHPAARNCPITLLIKSGVGGGVSACLYSRFIAFHLKAPSWWNGCTSTHCTFFIGATNRAIFSTFAGSSVRRRYQSETHPHRLADRSQPLCEAQGRSQFTLRCRTISCRV